MKLKRVSVIANIAIPAASILLVLSGTYSFIFFNEMHLLKKQQNALASENYRLTNKVIRYEMLKEMRLMSHLEAENKALKDELKSKGKSVKVLKTRTSKPIPEVEDDGRFSKTLYDIERLDKKAFNNGLEGL
jgi:hypothetical protein